MLEYRILFQQTLAGKGPIRLELASKREAYNLRQKFYRYREQIRNNPSDELAVLVDQLKFELGGNVLRILHNIPPTAVIEAALEANHDNN